jgi:selenocysteine lyase/cysteine desulfurase
MEKERSSAIANVAIDGYSPVELADKLFNQYKIFTVAIDTPPVHGVRVTPHLFTQIDDLDRFVNVLGQLCVG